MVAQLLHGITFALFHATTFRYVFRPVGKRRIGVGMTVYGALGNGLALFFGSLIGDYIIDAFGFQLFYAVYSLPVMVGIIILIASGKRMGIP